MKILNEITPIFDITGHFYMEYNNNVFELSVNNKNELEIYQIFNNDNFQFEVNEKANFTIGNLNLLSNSNTLKSKVIREYIKDKSENPDEEYESDEELDTSTMEDINNKMTYYPEDLEIEENINIDEDFLENKFNFYGNLNKSMLLFDPPCFETLVLGDLMQVIFRTSIKNNQPFYRITFYSNNTIDLNIIGTKIKSYSIDWNNIAIELTNNN